MQCLSFRSRLIPIIQEAGELLTRCDIEIAPVRVSLSLPKSKFPDEKIKAASHIYNELAPIILIDRKVPEEKDSEE